MATRKQLDATRRQAMQAEAYGRDVRDLMAGALGMNGWLVGESNEVRIAASATQAFRLAGLVLAAPGVVAHARLGAVRVTRRGPGYVDVERVADFRDFRIAGLAC